VSLGTVLIGGFVALVAAGVYGCTDEGFDDPVGRTLVGVLAGLLAVALFR
jgi:hypothetical protein